MRLRLDTHALLWWVSDDSQLGQVARDLIAEAKCARHVAKWAGIAPLGPVKAVEMAIMLRWKQPSRHAVFRLGWILVILPSVGGGWAFHMGNVRLDMTRLP